MAVETETKPAADAPPIDDAMHSMGTRRVFFGANVLLMIVFAFALLVCVNWLCAWASYRTDLSRLGAYELSERSRNIVADTKGKIRLTSIYTSDDPEKSREKYLPRVRDLFAEYARLGSNVTVQNISEDSEKRQLAKHLEELFNTEAKEHREALESARDLYKKLSDWSTEQAATFGDVEMKQGWLAKFTSFTNSTLNLSGLKDEIDKSLKQIDELVTGDLPKYAEANRSVKELNDKLLKTALESTGNFLNDLGSLVRSVQSGDETFFAESPQKMSELVSLGAELRDAVGAVGSPMPDDPRPALQEGAKDLGKIATWLAAEVGRIDEFTKRHPIISQHPLWRFKQQVSIIVTETTLPEMLGAAQRDVGDVRAQIRELLQQPDVETRKLQNALERLRQIVAQFNRTFDSASTALSRLKDDFARVDPESTNLLSEAYYDTQFKPHLEALDELNKKIDELPKLETGELAEQLREDNVVVVEADGKAAAVAFDEMWPLAGMGASTDEPRRVFNGDAAVSQALLNLINDKPFAQVIITHFETEVQEERFKRFARPLAGDLPSYTMEALHHRLLDMNFNVVVWNMGRDPAPPEAIEGVPRVFLVLPPPDPRNVTPGMANMFRTWTPEDETVLRNAIGKDGKAIFLTTYSQPRPINPLQQRGPFVQYDYLLKDYLKNTWGVDVDVFHRITFGITDSENPNRFGVSAESWTYPPMNSFTMQPIGKPLRNRRVYMLNVNAVEVADPPPAGVHAEYVLRIEDQDRYFGMQNVARVVEELMQPGAEGWVEKDNDPSDGWVDTKPPFGVIVASQNSEGGKAVVFGSGASFVSNYLEQPIFRQAAGGRIIFDPPPTSNVDLMVNALYWLIGRESLIAAGPVVTPVIATVSRSERNWLSVAVIIWSIAALALGGVVLFTRRR